MKDFLFHTFLNMKSDQADENLIHENIIAGVKLKGSPLMILFCSVFIASIGLNSNSIPEIIGAMLISPLMRPVIAIGYGVSIYDWKLLKNAVLVLLAEIFIAILSATIYFSITPKIGLTSEILLRTTPSFFDMLIAIFGGVAGIVGLTRKDKATIIPGVAISVSLISPMSTIGYGIVSGQLNYIIGASYLFLLKIFFIIISTYLFCRILKLHEIDETKGFSLKSSKTKIQLFSILIAIVMVISSLFVANKTIGENKIASSVDKFVSEKFVNDNTAIIKSDVNIKNQTIRIDLIGKKYSYEQIELAKLDLDKYGLLNYKLIVIQDINISLLDFYKSNNALVSTTIIE